MTKHEMLTLLIETEDEIFKMDQVLEQLTGYGHDTGELKKLDNVYEVIYHHSHTIYRENPDEGQELFFSILMNRNLSPDERATILIDGITVRE